MISVCMLYPMQKYPVHLPKVSPPPVLSQFLDCYGPRGFVLKLSGQVIVGVFCRSVHASALGGVFFLRVCVLDRREVVWG